MNVIADILTPQAQAVRRGLCPTTKLFRVFRRWYYHRVEEIRMNGTFFKIIEDDSDVRITLHESINLTKYNAAEIRRTHERDRGKDDIFGASIDMAFYALKTQHPADEVTCSKTRSWNW